LIQKCIYGVDIQQIAVEIAKLRFFISLLVDEKIDQTKDNWGIEPLPNLDFKIMQGNSLISEFLGIDFDNGDDKQEKLVQAYLSLGEEDDSLIKEFERKKIDYQSESDKDKKAKLKNEVEDLMIKLFESKVKKQKAGYFKDIGEIERKYSVLPNKQSREEIIAKEKQKLSQKSGFDLEKIEKQLREFTSKKKTRRFFPWKLYFAEVFENGGFDIVIANPPYRVLTKNNTPINEHGYYIKHYKAIEVSYSKNLFTLFIEQSMKLLRPKANLSYIVPEGLFKTRSYKGCVDLMEKEGNTKSVVTFTDYVFENAVTGNLIFLFERGWKGETSYFHFNTKYELSKIEVKENKVISKIEKNSVSLKEITTMYKGMVVKDRDTVLFAEKKNNENDFLLGKNISKWKIISKYYTNYDNLQIIGGTKKLIKHNQVPRILIRRTGDTLCCAYLEKPALTESTLYSCWSTSQKFSDKFLIGLLNSKVLDYYSKILFITNQQGFPQILMTDLEQLPIKQISTIDQKPFIEIVDKILAITKTNDYLENPDKQTKVKEYEKQIDQMVYNLYGLTEDEIKIVEGKR
jgi:hypothetical protein